MDKSETIGELVKALSAAQAEMPKVIKGAVNPHFRSTFADLADVMGPTLPVLAKHGLAVVQLPGGGIENQHLTTMLMHTSGEWISTQMPMFMPQGTAQAQGSALTYARRYAYSAMVGIAADDDDGQAATEQAPTRKPAYKGRTIDPAVDYPAPAKKVPAWTKAQKDELRELLAAQDITSQSDVALVIGGHIGRTVEGLDTITKAEAATAIDKVKAAA